MNPFQMLEAAIEACRHGQKVDALEAVTRLIGFFKPESRLNHVTHHLEIVQQHLLKDDCFLVDIRENLEGLQMYLSATAMLNLAGLIEAVLPAAAKMPKEEQLHKVHLN